MKILGKTSDGYLVKVWETAAGDIVVAVMDGIVYPPTSTSSWAAHSHDGNVERYEGPEKAEGLLRSARAHPSLLDPILVEMWGKLPMAGLLAAVGRR